MTAYTSWYEVTTELTVASRRDPAEIEYELSLIGGGLPLRANRCMLCLIHSNVTLLNRRS